MCKHRWGALDEDLLPACTVGPAVVKYGSGQELSDADQLPAQSASPQIKSRVLFINDVLRTHEYASYIEKMYNTEPYHSNVVCTSKYTTFNFLPKSLFEQFRRVANFYFLVISLLQLCTNLSPTNEYSTIGPLAIVLFAAVVNEGMEGRLRHQQDYVVNHQKAEVLGATSDNQIADQSSSKVTHTPAPPLGSSDGRGSGESSRALSFQPVFWKNLRVGHVIKVHDKEQIPADIVLLFSSHEDSEAMCETSSLDGESNLKVRHCMHFDGVLRVSYASEQVKTEAIARREKQHPSFRSKLQSFPHGTFRDVEEIPINIENVLLRGMKLCNTKWVIGVVVGAGNDTKPVQNMKAIPSKFSRLEGKSSIRWSSRVHSSVACCFVIPRWNTLNGSLESTGAFLWSGLLSPKYECKYFGSSPDEVALLNAVIEFKCVYEERDGDLIHIKLFGKSETYRLLALNEFDSTRKCMSVTVQQVHSLSDDEDDENDPDRLKKRKQRRRRRNHQPTSTSEEKRDSFVDLERDLATGEEDNRDQDESYSDAATANDDEILVFSKGADTVTFANAANAQDISKLGLHVRYFAAMALCALLLGFKTLSKNEYLVLKSERDMARKSLSDREHLCLEVAKKIEKSTYLLGATGVEDLLQDGVKECIDQLSQAGVNIWMLTGDKDETAISVGQMCGLIGEKSKMIIIKGKSKQDCLDEIANARRKLKREGVWVPGVATRNISLVVNYEALEFLLSDALTAPTAKTAITSERASVSTVDAFGAEDREAGHMGNTFLINESASTKSASSLPLQIPGQHDHHPSFAVGRSQRVASRHGSSRPSVADNSPVVPSYELFMGLATQCTSVVACRLSPMQKAQVVGLMKSAPGSPLTLAIGDGGNDVSMIQEEHVGIGIYGHEGMQAVRAADFAIATFENLSRLLLVHGRWNHRRVARVILFSFYKDMSLIMTLFIFSLRNAYSDQTLYESYLMVGWNVLYTVLPIFVLGITDEDIRDSTVLKHPSVHRSTLKRSEVSIKKLAMWVLNAVMHSVLVFFFTMSALDGISSSEGHANGLFTEFNSSSKLNYDDFSIANLRTNKLTEASLTRSEDQIQVGPTPPGRTDLTASLMDGEWSQKFRDFDRPTEHDELSKQLVALQRELAQEIGLPDPILDEDDTQSSRALNVQPSIHPLTLEFMGEEHLTLENEYELTFSIRERLRVILYLKLLAFVIPLYAIYEYFREGESSYIWIHAGFFICDVVYMRIARTKFFVEYYQSAILVPLCAIGMTLTLTISDTGKFAAALYPIVLFVVTRVKFLYALILSIYNFAFYLLADKVGIKDESSQNLSDLLLFALYMAFVISFGAYSCYSLQITMRRDFLQSRSLLIEQKRSTQILKNMLPEHVMQRMQKGDSLISEDEKDVTILFCDIADFASFVNRFGPTEVVSLLDRVYSLFDQICQKHGVRKMETVGKTYMACAGLQGKDRGKEAALRAVSMAIDMLSFLDKCRASNGNGIKLRIGIHSGRVVTYKKLAGHFSFEERQIDVKGKGAMTAYMVGEPLSEIARMAVLGQLEHIMKRESVIFSEQNVLKAFETDFLSATRNKIVQKAKKRWAKYDPIRLLFGAPLLSQFDGKAGGSSSAEAGMLSEIQWLLLYFKENEMEHKYLENTLGDRVEGARTTLFLLALYAVFTCLRDLTLELLQDAYDDDPGNTISASTYVIMLLIRSIYALIAVFFARRARLEFPDYSELKLRNVLIGLYLIGLVCFTISEALLWRLSYIMEIDTPPRYVNLCLDTVLAMFVVSNGGSILHRHIVSFNLLALVVVSVTSLTSLQVYHQDAAKFNSNFKTSYPLVLTFISVITNFVASQSVKFFTRRQIWLKTRTQLETMNADRLLHQMLPAAVVMRLKEGEMVCDQHQQVGILFSDIKGFTSIASQADTVQVVNILASLFCAFDKLTEKHGVFKMQAIGDAYVIVSGLPYVDMSLGPVIGTTSGVTSGMPQTRSTSSRVLPLATIDQGLASTERSGGHSALAHRSTLKHKFQMHIRSHIHDLLAMARDMHKEVRKVQDPNTGERLQMRIGIHIGNIIGGVIGTTTLRYDMWGPDALTANGLESNGVPEKTLVGPIVMEVAKGMPDIRCTFHKKASFTNVSLMDTHLVDFVELLDNDGNASNASSNHTIAPIGSVNGDGDADTSPKSVSSITLPDDDTGRTGSSSNMKPIASVLSSSVIRASLSQQSSNRSITRGHLGKATPLSAILGSSSLRNVGGGGATPTSSLDQKEVHASDSANRRTTSSPSMERITQNTLHTVEDV
ncbi:Phospholipid-transporting atpase, partial [Globisporangium splendens]